MNLALVLVLLAASAALWPAAQGRLPSRAGMATPDRSRPSDRGLPDQRDLREIRNPPDGHPRDGGPPDDGVAAEGDSAAGGSRGWRGRARTLALEAALAELVSAIAAPLRAGTPPSVALAAAEPSFAADPTLAPLLRDLVAATSTGASAASVWLHHAGLHGSADLQFLGHAWALSERTGAPLADALASGEEVLRARARGRARVASAAAGPRASMAVLCLLPASGPVVGAAVGVDPRVLYFSSPVATASLILGLVLAALALWWSRRILRGAA